MTAAGPVTQINVSYLNGLKSNLQDLLDQVDQQLEGLGPSGATSATTSDIPAVTSALKVAAGASPFAAGASLNSALAAMGGSVNDQLTWLKKVLTDMISDINNTVSGFSATESLNDEAATQLASQFQATITDLSTPAASSATPATPAASTVNPNVPAASTVNPKTTSGK
jgi:hypothetical protein